MKEILIPVVVIVLGILFLSVWAAMMEAKSYNKFCEKPVTWVDAHFLDLRIDECN